MMRSAAAYTSALCFRIYLARRIILIQFIILISVIFNYILGLRWNSSFNIAQDGWKLAETSEYHVMKLLMYIILYNYCALYNYFTFIRLDVIILLLEYRESFY